MEALRSAIEAEVTEYCLQHYRHGVCSTMSKNTEVGQTIVCCIEDHQFQPKNYWNGRWRSQWSLVVSGGQAVMSSTKEAFRALFRESELLGPSRARTF